MALYFFNFSTSPEPLITTRFSTKCDIVEVGPLYFSQNYRIPKGLFVGESPQFFSAGLRWLCLSLTMHHLSRSTFTHFFSRLLTGADEEYIYMNKVIVGNKDKSEKGAKTFYYVLENKQPKNVFNVAVFEHCLKSPLLE